MAGCWKAPSYQRAIKLTAYDIANSLILLLSHFERANLMRICIAKRMKRKDEFVLLDFDFSILKSFTVNSNIIENDVLFSNSYSNNHLINYSYSQLYIIKHIQKWKFFASLRRRILSATDICWLLSSCRAMYLQCSEKYSNN